METQTTPVIEQSHQQHPPERLQDVTRDVFLLGAAVSIGTSLMLRVLGRQHDALFVGQWAPTLLLLGLYTRRHPEAFQEFTSEYREPTPSMH